MNLPRIGVRNPVFANLLMWGIILGGVFYWFNLIREMFPNFDTDQVIVSVLYPGATPEAPGRVPSSRSGRPRGCRRATA